MPPSRHPVPPSDEVTVEATPAVRPAASPRSLPPAAAVYPVPTPAAQQQSSPAVVGESAAESLAAMTIYLGVTQTRSCRTCASQP